LTGIGLGLHLLDAGLPEFGTKKNAIAVATKLGLHWHCLLYQRLTRTGKVFEDWESAVAVNLASLAVNKKLIPAPLPDQTAAPSSNRFELRSQFRAGVSLPLPLFLKAPSPLPPVETGVRRQSGPQVSRRHTAVVEER